MSTNAPVTLLKLVSVPVAGLVAVMFTLVWLGGSDAVFGQEGSTSPIWSSTMTTDLVYQDYGYIDIESYRRGSLTNKTFEIDGVTYTVKIIEASGWLYIGFDKKVPIDFTLDVDGTRFNSSDASFTSYSYAEIFWWDYRDLFWDDGDKVNLAIYRTEDGGNSSPGASGSTVQNTAATGTPTISGTAKVGQTLTADTSGITDSDGLANVSYGYQWIRNDGTDDSDISGATSSRYTLVDADESKYIKVKVSFTDDANNDEELISVATGKVAKRPNSPATGAPTIMGTARVGQTLTADTSGIADADELSNVSYSYQWIRNDGTDDADITGATSSSYILLAADEGKYIKVKVSFTDDANNDEELTSSLTGKVAKRPNRAATGAPTISGTAKVGQTLTADTSRISDADGLTSVSYSYQWIGNDGATDTNITGATSSSYLLLASDEGNTIKVKVSFTDDAGYDETLTSTSTEAVSLTIQQQGSNSPATGAPTISGTAQVGQTLTADTSGISDTDGLTNVSYSYQWIRNDDTDDTNITSATSSSYTLQDADEGKHIKVKVSFSRTMPTTMKN